MKFRKKPIIVDAITFDELVKHGITSGGNIVDGMPWSFQYNGHPITHENDDCYLIPTLEGIMRMTRKDMLLTGVNGEIYPCKKDIFDATYESAEQAPSMNLFIVGIYAGNGAWGFAGAFSDESQAIKACVDKAYFIGPAKLNERIPDESMDWPDLYYPMRGRNGSNA